MSLHMLLQRQHLKIALLIVSGSDANLMIRGDDEADAYEEEAPVVAKNTKEKPTVTPVKASDELASKLDSLFDE